MVMRNVVKEEFALPAKEGSVNSGSSAFQEGPVRLAEVRDRRISVVKLRESHFKLEAELD
jgi:hypothetical protein